MGNARSSNNTRPLTEINAIIQNTPPSRLYVLLLEIAKNENPSCNGVNRQVFTAHIFTGYEILSNSLFDFLVGDQEILTSDQYNVKVDELFSCNSYSEKFMLYTGMFCGQSEKISSSEFKVLVELVHRISMDNNPAGPQECLLKDHVVDSLIRGLFHRRSSITVAHLLHSTKTNCPGLILILHDYVLYELQTQYKKILAPSNIALLSMISSDRISEVSAKVSAKINFALRSTTLLKLPPSAVWILSTVLPSVYTDPHNLKDQFNLSKNVSTISTTAKMTFTSPEHWSLLYDSDTDGRKSFTFHIKHYKGPTILFVFFENNLEMCICASEEWVSRENIWGDANCYLIQLFPDYRIIHRGPKIIYFNTSESAVYNGIRIGHNLDKPTMSVDKKLQFGAYRNNKLRILSVEMWACGSPKVRQLQMQFRDMQQKCAERRSNLSVEQSDLSKQVRKK